MLVGRCCCGEERYDIGTNSKLVPGEAVMPDVFLPFQWGVIAPAGTREINVPSAQDYRLSDPFDHTQVILLILGTGFLPHVDSTRAFLERGGTVVLIMGYNASSPNVHPVISGWLNEFGCSMSPLVAAPPYWVEPNNGPNNTDTGTVVAHALTTGVSIWQTGGAPHMTEGAGTVLARHSTGATVLAVENVLNGKIFLYAGPSYEINLPIANDHQRMLKNIYDDVAESFPNSPTLVTTIAFWGDCTDDAAPIDWTLRLPQGYTIVKNADDDDFETPGLGMMIMGMASTGGFSNWDIPSETQPSIDFLAAGGTILIVGEMANSDPGDLVMRPADITATNTYLAGIGAGMRLGTVTGTRSLLSYAVADSHALTYGLYASGADFPVQQPGAILINEPVAQRKLLTSTVVIAAVETIGAGDGRVIIVMDSFWLTRARATPITYGTTDYSLRFLLNIVRTMKPPGRVLAPATQIQSYNVISGNQDNTADYNSIFNVALIDSVHWFDGIQISQGTPITSAIWKLTPGTSSADPGVFFDVTVRASNTDDAANPTGITSYGSYSWIVQTASISVAADPPPALITVDVTTIIQAIVDRPGWTTANGLSLNLNGIGTGVDEGYDIQWADSRMVINTG